MEKFKNVEPIIKAVELENRVADKYQREEAKVVIKNMDKDPKYFIKRNMVSVYKVNDQVQNQIGYEEYQKKEAKAKVESRYGIMPTYLINRKKEAELEKRQTLLDIKLNQRPQGTIRLQDTEILQMRESLNNEKKALSHQIERTTISNYTNRAKNQTKTITKKLDQVDKALTVFNREAVFIKC